MAYRFEQYINLHEPHVEVVRDVLFGDHKDTKAFNVKFRRTFPEGKDHYSNCIFRTHTKAIPGYYKHGLVSAKNGEHSGMVHLVHHAKLDGEKIGKYLCSTTKMRDFTLENVWGPHDWCHYRNWGSDVYREVDLYDPGEYRLHGRPLNTDSESSDEFSDDELGGNRGIRPFEERTGVYFVSIMDGAEIGRFNMNEDVLCGNWNYGLRITDTWGDAYAYVYGDFLVHDAVRVLRNPRKGKNGKEFFHPDYEIDEKCTFQEPFNYFRLTRG
jgi:hypothetical protein